MSKKSDKNILKICSEFKKGILGGKPSRLMCFAVSAPLQTYLRFCGIETKLVEGEIEFEDSLINHYWLELADGRIIDATADQFKEMPEIYIGKKPEWYNLTNPPATTREPQ